MDSGSEIKVLGGGRKHETGTRRTLIARSLSIVFYLVFYLVMNDRMKILTPSDGSKTKNTKVVKRRRVRMELLKRGGLWQGGL